MEFAPIVLFVYNRPQHMRRTVDSLRANGLAEHSDLFIFSDAPRNQTAAAAVEVIRSYIRGIDGFRSVTVVERAVNFGLAKSVITGVTELCDQYGRAIVVEDDMLTAPDFLTFMNRALDRYEDEKKVFSISGFNFGVKPQEDYSYDAFFAYRSSSWGWGTWKDRWGKADWSMSDYLEFSVDATRQKLFDRGGEDLCRMLRLQMAGRSDSWAIRWAYTHSKHGGYALLPTASRVYNIGLDGSGVHCNSGSAKQSTLSVENESEYRLPDAVKVDPYFANEIQRMCRPSLPRKFVRYFRDRLQS